VAKRRSLDDALTPEEEAFLRPPTPITSNTPNPDPRPKPEPKKEQPTMSRTALKERFTQDTPQPDSNPAQHTLAGTGSINARIDPRITTSLLRASVERRIAGVTPSTQREIIAEALTLWLKKNGFWK